MKVADVFLLRAVTGGAIALALLIAAYNIAGSIFLFIDGKMIYAAFT